MKKEGRRREPAAFCCGQGCFGALRGLWGVVRGELAGPGGLVAREIALVGV